MNNTEGNYYEEPQSKQLMTYEIDEDEKPQKAQAKPTQKFIFSHLLQNVLDSKSNFSVPRNFNPKPNIPFNKSVLKRWDWKALAKNLNAKIDSTPCIGFIPQS